MSLPDPAKAHVDDLVVALERANPEDPRRHLIAEAVVLLHSALTADNPTLMADRLGAFNGDLSSLLTKWKIVVSAHRSPQGAPIHPKVG